MDFNFQPLEERIVYDASLGGLVGGDGGLEGGGGGDDSSGGGGGGGIIVQIPPSAQDDAYNVDEDNTLAVNAADGVLSNDSDSNSDPLSASLISGPSHGNLTLNADGSFTYTPDANYFGSDSFIYNVSDGAGGNDQATVNITVNPINDAPSAADDAYNVDEDNILAVAAIDGVLANDSDVDSSSLTASLVSGPAHGSLALNADGSFTYTPNADYFGSDSFVYNVSDGDDGNMEATANITVNSINDAPVAADDAYNVDEDNILAVAAIDGVLANDSDIDSSSLTASLVSGPANGSLALNADGSFTYTPNADYFGSDSFVYNVSDGDGGNVEATANITVNSINDAPVASDDAYVNSFDLKGDRTLIVNASEGLLSNDSDIDTSLNDLSVSLINGPDNGTLALNSDGSLSYTPDKGFFGHDSFTYQVNDGDLDSNIATVSIDNAVNPIVKLFGSNNRHYIEGHKAVTLAPAAFVMDVDTPNFDNGQLIVDVVENGTDNDLLSFKTRGKFSIDASNNIYIKNELIGSYQGGEGQDPLVITFNSNADAKDVAKTIRHITYSNVSDNPSIATRKISFMLDDGDGGMSQEQFKNVHIFSVNDTPEIMSSVDGATINLGDEVMLGDALNLTIQDVDSPDDIMEVKLKVKKGALNFMDDLSDLNSIIFDVEPDVDGLAKMSFSGTVTELNIALSRLSYSADEVGTFDFKIKVKDLGTSSTLGGTESDWEVFTITVV